MRGDKYIKNSLNYNVEYRDGQKSKGDKIGMPFRHSTGDALKETAG